jgi:hypothetical protein
MRARLAVIHTRSGAVEPANWTQMESVRLNFFPHTAPGNQKLRLACQVGFL